MRTFVLTENQARLIAESELLDEMYENFTHYDVLQDFISDKAHGVKVMSWGALIPAEQYHNLLKRFQQMGEFARIPNIVRDWFAIIARNTLLLSATTDFAGHSAYFPYDDFADSFSEEEFNDVLGRGGDMTNFHDCCEFLDKIGFYDWTKLPDGSDAWSDYGLEPLFRVLNEYDDSATSNEETLILINRALDVYHQRGNLSSAFIEGGDATCDKISNS